MMDDHELRTTRLLLRRWREADRQPFASLNADPIVMRFYPAPLSRPESDAFIDRIETGFDEYGWGLWALELVETGEFLGYTGLSPVTFEAHFTPAVEVGWRLAAQHWGQGYATEAAIAALTFGFDTVGLAETVSFTTPTNTPSQRVMQRLGMHHDPIEDFDHPRLPDGHPLQRHVLYRITADEWRHHLA
jgi:RimJ/RimL family protein N-acetyltransferase